MMVLVRRRAQTFGRQHLRGTRWRYRQRWPAFNGSRRNGDGFYCARGESNLLGIRRRLRAREWAAGNCGGVGGLGVVVGCWDALCGLMGSISAWRAYSETH